MKNIVIAAGYATRLGELTKNFPKPLLKIGNSTILGRMLDDIDKIDDVDEHIIITNHKFAGIFEDWKKDLHYSKPITIVDDGTETNETRLGAVCDLLYAMDKLHIDDDLLVVAADNLLFFSFQEFVDFARAKGTSCIMCHEQPSIEKLQRTGVVELDENMRVLGMEEKPQVPKSHWAVPPFYIYLRKDLDLVRHSVENGCGKDAPGNLAHYMVENTTMHAWPMSAGRFDIGSLDTYYEAVKRFGCFHSFSLAQRKRTKRDIPPTKALTDGRPLSRLEIVEASFTLFSLLHRFPQGKDATRKVAETDDFSPFW